MIHERRKMFCFHVFVFYYFSVAAVETTSRDSRPPMCNRSSNVSVNYTLELSTSGPAILGSTVIFTAQLWANPNTTAVEGEFYYVWFNTADMSQTEFVGIHILEWNKTFDRKSVYPGEFLMTVVVKSTNDSANIVTFGNVVFTLTKYLNGKLEVMQNLPYQRHPNIFAIDQQTHFHVNITDKFNTSDRPDYTYSWYNGSNIIGRSKIPHLVKKFSEPNVLHLQANVLADFYVLSYLLESVNIDRFGSFSEKLTFKESLYNCTLTRLDSNDGDESVKLGDSVLVNISCAGSSPSAVCWNMTSLNMTLNNTCMPPEIFQNETHHLVSVAIGQVGWHTVQFAIFNDVSIAVLSQKYYVYDADSVNIPALVFPVVFVMLGIVITAVGGIYIVRLRQRMHVEVADFDFDPNISERRTNILSRVASAVKHFFLRFTHLTRTNNQSDANGSYNFYDSL